MESESNYQGVALAQVGAFTFPAEEMRGKIENPIGAVQMPLGVAGPLLFGLVTQWSGAGRFAVLTLLPFFIGGAWLLLTVDLERGARRAQEQ